MNYIEIEKMKGRQLTDIDIEEVSLVDTACVLDERGKNKKFVIIKNENKPKQKWNSIQKSFLGYTDDDLADLPDNIIDNEPVQKSTKENPFPSICKAIDKNKKRVENYLDQLSDENWLLGNKK